GGGDDDDARVPHPLDGDVDRVVAIRPGRVDRQREVDDPGPEDVAGGGHPVEAGQDVHQVGRPVGAGALHGDEAGARRHTLDRPVGSGAGTGDEAGDEGAVAVAVDVVVLRREVDAADHLAGQVADRVDAGVDHGDPDAVPGVALVPCLGRPDGVGVDGAGPAAALAVLPGQR